MRDAVRELIRMIQSTNRTHDILQLSEIFKREVDNLNSKCDYDFKGEMLNNLQFLVDALENNNN